MWPPTCTACAQAVRGSRVAWPVLVVSASCLVAMQWAQCRPLLGFALQWSALLEDQGSRMFLITVLDCDHRVGTEIANHVKNQRPLQWKESEEKRERAKKK
jgi:hypothetical protein